MALVDALKARQIKGESIKPPPGVEEKLKRGRDAMRSEAPQRNEYLAFARGEQYRWVEPSSNILRSQSTTSNYDGSGKPRHRVRSVRNFIFDHVETLVAAATERIPGYSIAATSTDPRREGAARLARKVAYYGYEPWGVDTATERAIRYAVIADEGFVWPYFDNTIGPYYEVEGPDGGPTPLAEGEIRHRVFGPNEVFWEPGVRFEESRWHGIEQARDLDATMEMEGYVGGKLDPDAQQAETSQRDVTQERLVMVTDYLERPTPRRPDGRWITLANGRVIVQERKYPCVDAEGKVLDEPVLHRLTYAEDPDSERGLGLVRHLIDAQRTLNHAVSKIAEWMNLAPNPQIVVLNGRLKDKLNDQPGAVFRAVGTEIKFRPIPPLPPEVFTQKEEATADMARIAAQNDIPAQVESGKGIEQLRSKDLGRHSTFFKNLARFHSRLARHNLYLVQRHYSVPRLLKVQGDRGIERIPDFLGSQLLGEVDVRVSPDSLEPRTRESIEAKILAFADRGWVTPHAAMAAINSGTAESLVEGYERDVARANLVIQKIKDGPETLFNTPPRRPFQGEEPGLDETGAPREYMPGWLPRPFDNVRVHLDVFADWMKSGEYDALPPPQMEAANAYYDALLGIEATQRAQQAAAQEEMAQALGSANAARPQAPAPLPSQASIAQE